MTKYPTTPLDRYQAGDYLRVAKRLASKSKTPIKGSLIDKEIETGIRYFMRKYGLTVSDILNFDAAFKRVEERSDEFTNGLSDLGFLSKFKARVISKSQNERLEFEKLLETGPFAYFSWKCLQTKTVEEASVNVPRIFGYFPESLTSWKTLYLDLIHPDDREKVRRNILTHTVSRTEEFDLYYRIIRSDGEIRFVRDHAQVSYGDGGKIEQSNSLILDVTEREESLFIIDEYVHAIDQSAIVQVVDREGVIIYANDLYREVSWDTRNIVGKPVRILWGRKYHGEEFWKNLWSTVLEGKIWSGVVQNPLPKNPDKSYYAHTTITPIRNVKGEYDRFIAIKFDVTRLKEVESALRNVNARFEKIIDSTSQGFWSLSEDLRILEVNSSFCRMTGYERSELIGRNIRELFKEKDREILESHAKNVVTTNHRKCNLDILKKDGTLLPITINATTLRDESGNFVEAISFITDATEEKSLQAQLYFASITDELTQIENRRHFERELSRSFEDLRHWKISNLSLAILDIDHFKRVNDSFGHHGGDRVLRFFGRKLAELSGPQFMVFRLGGEEFWILGKDVPLDLMREAVENFRKEIQLAPIDIEASHPLKITTSAGVASIDSASVASKTEQDLYRSADALLYLAKNSGRNNVKAQGDI